MFGDRLTSTSRYIKHPDSSVWLIDGEPVTSADMMIIDSNLNHLAGESYRHLVWDGKRSVVPDKASDGWLIIRDNGQPVSTSGANVIAWSQANAYQYGPFPGILEQVGTSGDDFRLRKIRIDVRGYTDASATVYLYAAMTGSAFGGGVDSGFPQDGRTIAFGTDSVGTGVGHYLRTITLTPSVMSRRQGTPVICRSSSSALRGSQFVVVPGFKLWLGWVFGDTVNHGSIYSVSAYEVP
jgi:hypothetical protein